MDMAMNEVKKLLIQNIVITYTVLDVYAAATTMNDA